MGRNLIALAHYSIQAAQKLRDAKVCLPRSWLVEPGPSCINFRTLFKKKHKEG